MGPVSLLSSPPRRWSRVVTLFVAQDGVTWRAVCQPVLVPLLVLSQDRGETRAHFFRDLEKFETDVVASGASGLELVDPHHPRQHLDGAVRARQEVEVEP